MRYSLLAASGIVPTLDDHLENLLLLGIGFLLIIFVLIAGAIIANGFSKAFETIADWLEHKSANRRRKRRRTSFRKHYPAPLRAVVSTPQPKALDALARNAAAQETATTHLRLVKSRAKH